MPQATITLGGFALQYNPYPSMQPPKKTVIHTLTLGGGYDTVYQPPSGGTFVQDQEAVLSWAVMDRTTYLQLVTLEGQLGTMTYVDPYGTSWTVLFEDLTHTSLLRGGDDAFEGVTAKLRIVSQP